MITVLLLIIGIIIYVLTLPLSVTKMALKLELKRIKVTEKYFKPVIDRVTTRLTRPEHINKSDSISKKAIKSTKNAGKEAIQATSKVNSVANIVKTAMLKATIATLGTIIKLLRALASILGVTSAIMLVIVVFASLSLVGAIVTVVILNNGNTTGSTTATKQHLTYSNKKNSNSSLSNTAGDPVKTCEKLANWYIKNVKVYGSTEFSCDLISGDRIRADCTGFASAYASLVAGKKKLAVYSDSAGFCKYDSVKKTMANLGWKKYSIKDFKSVNDLQPGDILCCNSAVGYGRGHHAEIYIDKHHTFGWGGVKTKYPVNNTIKKTSSGFVDDYHTYVIIYRYVGK